MILSPILSAKAQDKVDGDPIPCLVDSRYLLSKNKMFLNMANFLAYHNEVWLCSNQSISTKGMISLKTVVFVKKPGFSTTSFTSEMIMVVFDFSVSFSFRCTLLHASTTTYLSIMAHIVVQESWY